MRENGEEMDEKSRVAGFRRRWPAPARAPASSRKKARGAYVPARGGRVAPCLFWRVRARGVSKNFSKNFQLFFSLATFVSSRTGQNLCYINGKLYKKIKGRMFRSFYKCVEAKCDAELVVVDLKGGFLKIVRDHRPFCKNKGSLPTSFSSSSKIKCLLKDQ